MKPTQPGIYKIGLIVHKAEDAILPFTAKCELRATCGEVKVSAEGVKALFLHEGLNAKIIAMKGDKVTVEVTGTLTANYGVWSTAVAEKISDV